MGSRLLVAFPIQEFEGESSIKIAEEWGRVLGAEVRLFVNNPSNDLVELIRRASHEFIDLRLNTSANRYLADYAPIASWDPWGFKSGPNRDFFRILDWATSNRYDWTLLAERDMQPLREFPAAERSEFFRHRADTWMIGALPSPEVKKSLDPRLHDHLNGGAYYNTGASDFRLFRRRVWIPSLLEVIKLFPFYAYDCLTAQWTWNLLRTDLRSAWENNRDRFMASELLLNYSTIALSQDEIERLRQCDWPNEALVLHSKSHMCGQGTL